MQHSHTRIHHDTSVINRKYADLQCVQESLTGWTLAPADQIWSSSYSRGLPVLLLWVAWTWVLKAVPPQRFGKLSESHYNMWGRRTKKWWRFRSQFAAEIRVLSGHCLLCLLTWFVYCYFNDVFRKKGCPVSFFHVKLNIYFQLTHMISYSWIIIFGMFSMWNSICVSNWYEYWIHIYCYLFIWSRIFGHVFTFSP